MERQRSDLGFVEEQSRISIDCQSNSKAKESEPIHWLVFFFLKKLFWISKSWICSYWCWSGSWSRSWNSRSWSRSWPWSLFFINKNKNHIKHIQPNKSLIKTNFTKKTECLIYRRRRMINVEIDVSNNVIDPDRFHLKSKHSIYFFFLKKYIILEKTNEREKSRSFTWRSKIIVHVCCDYIWSDKQSISVDRKFVIVEFVFMIVIRTIVNNFTIKRFC